MKRSPRLALLAVATMVPLAAFGGCGDDDGATVRNLDGTAESGSASASASGSGSATASGSGAASGSGTAVECRPFGDPATATDTVAITLDEWEITFDTTELAAGSVAFEATNIGEDAHEVLVVRAGSLDDLPLSDDGHIDEAAIPEADFIGEIEPFPGGGETCTGVFDLEPGSYAVVCAIVEEEPDGTIEDHFMLGMATMITVS